MLYFPKTKNMNNFKNLIEEANEIETTDLLAVPGAATIKACSIVINSFLQIFPDDRRGSTITDEPVNDITSLNKNISLTEQAPINVDEAQLEIPVISKAQGMVHHLKHTHTKTSIS